MRSHSNQLTGEIPSEIGNLTNLTSLYLSSNQITGEIPESICEVFPLSCGFSISNNNLCPSYPDCGGGPITSEEQQNTSECVEYQLGDVNMDGLLDILDIVLGVNILLDIVEYTDEQYELLDYNQDGECNILDLVRIIDYIIGL